MDVCDAVLSRRDLGNPAEDFEGLSLRRLCGDLPWPAAPGPVVPVFLRRGDFPAAPGPDSVAVRACAGFAVLTLRPLAASQYTGLAAGNRSKKIALAAMALAASCSTLWMGTQGLAPLAAAWATGRPPGTAVSSWGGISGDISGFALTLGEFTGVAVLILTR